MSRLTISFLLLILFACTRGERWDRSAQQPGTGHSIAILPFHGVDSVLVSKIKLGLEEKLTARITILSWQKLPPGAYHKIRNRYIADDLLIYLDNTNDRQFDKIVGVTAADISTNKKPYGNWGIMGLGYCPGKACVISSYRVKATTKGNSHFIKRMIVLAMHELGHTYSLPHCKSSVCIMKDAEGKMNLDNGDKYCSDCIFFLKRKGILKT